MNNCAEVVKLSLSNASFVLLVNFFSVLFSSAFSFGNRWHIGRARGRISAQCARLTRRQRYRHGKRIFSW
jgi:hypothetical protein